MVKPPDLVEGRSYFDITYPDATLVKPIVATYEYVAVEKTEDDAGAKEPLFIQVSPIGYTTAQLSSLISMEELIAELTAIHRKIDSRSST